MSKPTHAKRGTGRPWWILRWALLLAAISGAVMFMTRMPGASHRGPLPPLTPAETRLHEGLAGHVAVLAAEIGERNIHRPRALGAAADYIHRRLAACGLDVRRQTYRCRGVEVANIVGQRTGGSRPDEIVVVGAHYDTVPGSPGANDNGSGVAALLELARRVGAPPGPGPARTLRFAAFVNEEPPFFQTGEMGSRVYARRARQRGENIVAMFSLETLGCYSDRPGSQRYPVPFSLFYPDTGNFVGFVADLSSRGLLRETIAGFRSTAAFPSEGLAAPRWLTGVGWSDHWAFWQSGYPAVMVTDTAPFRYPQYHTAADTPDRVDTRRLARVVSGLAAVFRRAAAAGGLAAAEPPQ